MKNFIRRAGTDVPAGIVVFLVAIPLCLGIAVASGLNEISGIIAGVVGGVIVGSISGSQLSVSGPAAGLTAIVAAALLKLPAVEAFFLAVVIAGIFQILMGVFKFGIIGDYIPNSVIKGMLAAIGIILILKQLPHLVGYDKDYEGNESFVQLSGENSISAFVHSFNFLTPSAIIIGVTGIVILIFYETRWVKSKKIFQLVSGPLVVVVAGVLLNRFLVGKEYQLLSRDAHLVNIPVASDAAEFFSFFKMPDWSFITNAEVWVAAITIALVASLETLLGIEAVDKLDSKKRVSPPNRELIAQGTGNMVSGLLGGLPLTSVIVRSSANVNAGAQSKMSTIFHGMLILICVAFLPGILNLIPKAALAAILVFTGYKLAKVSLFKEYYQKGWEQFMPFVVTLLAIIFTDLLTGVLIGIAVGIFFVIRSNFRTAIFSVHENNHHLIRLRKDVSFFSKPILKQKLEKLPANSRLVLDLTKAEFIDKDVIDTINEFIQHASLKNISVTLNKSTYNLSHQLVDNNPVKADDSAH
ncbi:MAG: SulP family inorganic anion transporter [Bacteroidetes bacterium]|nr:SulP family inorganic anion transporter [Bacteroidota bacterium]MBS1755932.1 SulP family inorganic anion transporter [Bacteroidota bacterium]